MSMAFFHALNKGNPEKSVSVMGEEEAWEKKNAGNAGLL